MKKAIVLAIAIRPAMRTGARRASNTGMAHHLTALSLQEAVNGQNR